MEKELLPPIYTRLKYLFLAFVIIFVLALLLTNKFATAIGMAIGNIIWPFIIPLVYAFYQRTIHKTKANDDKFWKIYWVTFFIVQILAFMGGIGNLLRK